MTCIRVGNAIVCVNDTGRLKVGNRYVWVDMHPYCGPSFWTTKRGREEPYEPEDENDPVWPAFTAWHEKQRAKKQRQQAQEGGK